MESKEELLQLCDAKIADFNKKAEDMRQKAMMWQDLKKELEKKVTK